MNSFICLLLQSYPFEILLFAASEVNTFGRTLHHSLLQRCGTLIIGHNLSKILVLNTLCSLQSTTKVCQLNYLYSKQHKDFVIGQVNTGTFISSVFKLSHM